MRRDNHNGVIFFLGLALVSGTVISQPISPTADVKSTSPTTPATTTVDLPYKPSENVLEISDTPLGPNPEPTTDTATENPSVTTVEPEKKYSFANIPYLALKYPEVKALPDPE